MTHYSFRILIILLLLTSFFVGQTAAGQFDKKVDSYVRSQMTKYKIPGITIAVVKNGRIAKLEGYGIASMEFDVPTDSETVYQLFSVSKIFAGVAAMKLVESGQLSLDTSVTDIIQDLPTEWKAIRIRNLLTHTSGMQEMGANPKFLSLPDDKKRQITAEEELRYVAELPLKFQPGAKFSYHQSGYRLLGLIIEKLTKKSYPDFLRESVFAPVGMLSTRFGGTEAPVMKHRSPSSYNLDSGELRAWLYPFTPRDYPAAGLNSSAPDLSKFLTALDAGKILKPESMRALWSPAPLNDGTTKNYGLGWTIDDHKGRKVVGHGGGGAIWVAHFPEEHLSVIVLCNLNGARADEIQYGIADLYLN